MNEFMDSDSTFPYSSSNQFLVLQNMSKKLDMDPSVPVLLLDENQSGFVNNLFCSNNFQEDVDAFFASDEMGSELLRFDKEKSFNSLINADVDLGNIIHGQKNGSNHSDSDIDVDIDIEGVSDDESLDSGKSEKMVYLCSQCSDAFGSIEECKQHMIQDHKLGLSFNAGAQDNVVASEPSDGGERTSAHCITLDEEEEPIIRETETLVTSDGDKNEALGVQKDETGIDPIVEPQSGTSKIDPVENQELGLEPETETPGLEAQLLKDPDFIAKSYRCDFLGCCIRFTTDKGCIMHQDCHEVNSRMYVCSQENCNEKFATWKQCNLHLWKAHQIDIDLFTCPVCSMYKTWSKHSLRTHIKIHLEEKRYACRKCSKKFKQKSQLVNHVAGVHAKKSAKENPNADNSDKWYTEKICKICSKTYADSKCLKKHVQAVHRKMKPYVCNICGHKSAKKAMMQIHIRSHTGEKPYACTYEGCSYRTGDHNSLRRHLMVHSGIRPYRCSYCPFSCIQSSALKKHLSSKHSDMKENEAVSSCTLCSFSTINPTLYKNHMNDHAKGLIEGNAQTVTVETQACSTLPTDDEDTTNCFPSDEGIVTGGITIPADPNQEPIVLLPPNCNSEFETNALIHG